MSSALFRSTAEGETGHAHGHLEYLEAVGDPATNLPIGRTRENLKAAVAGETHEYTDMYPGHGEAGARRRLRRDRRLVRDAGQGRAQPRQPLPEGAGRADATSMQGRQSLEAPTRHPLDWKNPEFWDPAKAEKELERIFDICHGCRRCVSLCTTFPTLFDLVDDSPTMEVDGVAKEDYAKVVDQCYLCDLCYMTKCPYVPPHPWNVDFPHVMLRAKAIKFSKGHQIPRPPALLHRRDGQARRDPGGRADGQRREQHSSRRARRCRRCSACTRTASCRLTRRRKFRSAAPKAKAFPVRDGKSTPGKVAIFATCYGNYNEPGMGHDLLAILEHNEIPYVLVEKEACCGMPKLELGDLEGVDALKEKNMPVLAKYAREGYAILAPVPSCTLMFKQELPLMYPEDAGRARGARRDVRSVRVLRAAEEGRPPEDRLQARRSARSSYHIPCHSRVQNMGQKTREALEIGARHAGDRGRALLGPRRHLGREGGVLRQLDEDRPPGVPPDGRAAEPDYVSSDCPIAARHIMQGMGSEAGTAEKAHPLSLLRKAYGI